MRSKRSNGKISLNVITGTHVVILGMDVKESELKDFLGFAIKRTDHTEDEIKWLKGFKTFKETEGQSAPCQEVDTIAHPIQAFYWGDYTAKPAHKYTYELVPVYGNPKNLRKGESVAVTISTENEDIGTHAVYFNRGVAGSQAFVKKFGNQKELSPEAHKWLARGLDQAILNFIAKAKSSEYSLRASVYEFSYMPVLEAFKKASDSGADVKIVYDHRKPDPYETSDRCIAKAGIKDLMIKRCQGSSYISHNKFIILLKNGKPMEVWTGSTNFTEGGIFGQSNVGHIVRDLKVAQTYYEYWQKISTDPDQDDFREWNSFHTPMPKVENKSDNFMNVVFSPRLSEAKSRKDNPYAMAWYAQQLEEARIMVNFTAAFGVNERLAKIFYEDKEYLRYLILDNKGRGEKSIEITEKIEADPDNRIAIGSYLEGKTPHGMVEEKLTHLNNHVKFLHTKYMILDALSTEPTLISGSANFSDASVKNNDENMLIVRGNTRVADMYLGEFMRLFHHYYFREVYNRITKKKGSGDHTKAYLCPDSSWVRKYYKEGSIHWKERLRFRGDTENGYSITFFDIDETLFHTSAKVLVLKNNKVVKELSNQEFNTYKLKSGEKFDFTQFRDAEIFKDHSKPIKQTISKIIEMSKTASLNGSKIALLTARQSFEDMATFKQAFLDQKIPIRKIDINFAGDIADKAGSIALAKKQIVEKYLAHGEYQEAILLDDNKENLDEFLSISKINKQVKFDAVLVKKDGAFINYFTSKAKTVKEN